MRRTVLLLALVACARGRSDEPIVDARPTDAAPTGDARLPDAAPDAAPSGTCPQAFTGVLATWSFAGQAGTQASTPVTSMAAGIAAGPITRAAALTAVAGTSSINSSNWPLTATRDAAKYYAFTLAPPAGCTLSIAGIAIDTLSSGTGPTMAQISTSVDSYAAVTAVTTSTSGLVAATVMNATGMVEVRIYGFAATGSGGTMRLQNALSVDGQLQ